MSVERFMRAVAVCALCCWQCLAGDSLSGPRRAEGEVNNTLSDVALTISVDSTPFGTLRKDNAISMSYDDEEMINEQVEPEDIMSHGMLSSKFACHPPGLFVTSSDLAVDGANVDFRALMFNLASPDDAEGGIAGNFVDAMRDTFLGDRGDENDRRLHRRLQGWGGEDDEGPDAEDHENRITIDDISFRTEKCEELSVGNATTCRVVKQTSTEVEPPLYVYVDESEEQPDTQELTVYPDFSARLSMVYTCKTAGLVLVHMNFNVKVGTSEETQPVCLRWLKRCADTWHGLSVVDGDFVSVVRDGSVAEGSQLFLGPVEHSQVASHFQMSATGLLNMDRPYAYVSDNPDILEVDLLGSYNEWMSFEVDAVPDDFTVEYHCLAKGVATVVMQLTKPDFEASAVEIKWQKTCAGKEAVKGEAHSNLQVLIGSATYNNKTEGVRAGIIRPGFARPCGRKRKSKFKGAAEAAASRVPKGADACVEKKPAFIVPRRDKTTTIELVPMVKGDDFPLFSPKPVVSFNAKKLKVLIKDHKDLMAPNKDTKKITLKYICFSEASSNVTLTLYMPGYKPVDVSWQKRCKKPAVHESQVVPLPEYGPLVIAIVACLLCAACAIGLVACRFLDAGGKGSKVATGEVAKAGELASMVGNSESGGVTWHE